MGARKGLSLELLFFGLAALCFGLVYWRGQDATPGFQPAEKALGAIRVVTWNLGTGVDAGTEGFREQDMALVVSVIKELDPDLIFLQELRGNHQLQRLAEDLGPGWQQVFAPVTSGRSLGLLAQRGILQPLEMPALDRALAVRYMRDTHVQLVAVCLHTDAFSAANRNRSVGLASDFLLENGGDERRMLLGDLNLDLGIDKRRDLFSDDEYQDVETYNYLAKSMVDIGIGKGPTAKPDRRIDYIFIREDGFRVTQVGPLMGRRAPEVDHHPLIADLIVED